MLTPVVALLLLPLLLILFHLYFFEAMKVVMVLLTLTYCFTANAMRGNLIVMMICLGFPPDGEATLLQPFVRGDKENGGSINHIVTDDDGSKLNLSPLAT
ncbi:hypothetical protein M6B38_318680 [Iris pallida]|uniref:Uncharacterized protein n=1 Tax=Iris pallida TaxID=29817 RepID=A0AAX6HE62_IRIPA|nr:hypothetical protein M6B38_318680 [Iris pallida]